MADNRLLNLQAGGAGPKGPPGPPSGAVPPPGKGAPPAPQGDKLPETPEEAIQVLDSFGITPDDFPLIKAAVEIVAEAMDAGEESKEPPGAADDQGPPAAA